MKRLKITSSGWAGFTGCLGQTQFKDGISVEPQPKQISDRLGSIMSVEFIDEDGVNSGRAGIATEIASSMTKTIDVKESAQRSEADREQELKTIALLMAKPRDTHTHAELVEIAKEGGIKGLRVIGDEWGVKGRAIPELIGDILVAQNTYKENRKELADQKAQREADEAEKAEVVDTDANAAPDPEEDENKGGTEGAEDGIGESQPGEELDEGSTTTLGETEEEQV